MSFACFARRLGGAVLFLVAASSPGQAQITESSRYASIVIEARGGNVISASGADEMRHPASLTKMMTLYMLSRRCAPAGGPIDAGALLYEASAQPPSKLGCRRGASSRWRRRSSRW
jgi:D-alanyl-D-alanine carboxypeptidase